jgi:hypothetical protein
MASNSPPDRQYRHIARAKGQEPDEDDETIGHYGAQFLSYHPHPMPSELGFRHHSHQQKIPSPMHGRHLPETAAGERDVVNDTIHSESSKIRKSPGATVKDAPYQLVDRPWQAVDRSKPDNQFGTSADRSPMQRWGSETVRQQAWNGVAAVQEGSPTKAGNARSSGGWSTQGHLGSERQQSSSGKRSKKSHAKR